MILAELLISAEIDPNELNGKVKYLAQDASSYTAYSYSEYPPLCNINDRYSGDFVLFTIDYPKQLASDWETPLSIEDYTAAWNAAHNVNVKEEENVKSEWPRVMISNNGLIVEFSNEVCGIVLEAGQSGWCNGDHCGCFVSCFDVDCWQPYIEEVKAEEWPKILQGVFSHDTERLLIVEILSENGEGRVLQDSKGAEWVINVTVDNLCSLFGTSYGHPYWKPYVSATQSPSAALPDVPVTLTAQDIVLRLEQLKTGIRAMQAIKDGLVKEYEELRDTLLTLI